MIKLIIQTLILIQVLVSCSTAPTRLSQQVGVASWYGRKFQGHRTASGEKYDMHKFTAAHRTLPFGTCVRVTRRSTGKTVRVRINDRGPFTEGRIIDLSYAAAAQLGLIQKGEDEVEIKPE